VPEPSALERLELVERQISVSETALARLPAWQPVPADVIALLATAMPLRAGELPPGLEPRLTRLMDRVDALIAELRDRERLLAGRVATVRAARRSGPAPSLIDYTS
jgi:hypothetical protein